VTPQFIRRFHPAIAIILFCCNAAFPASREYAIGPVPAWVRSPSVAYDAETPDDAADGVYYLLEEDQVRLAKDSIQTYTHYVIRLLNNTGVENNSQISIGFDPLYESVTVHFIRVVRNGKILDRLVKKDIRVLQRETELEYLIYSGARTLSLLLEDVQAGDCVEVGYTISGWNPIFGNRYAEVFDMQWESPVKHVYRRVLKERPSVLDVRFRNMGRPDERHREPGEDLVWERENVPGLSVDKDTPAWYDPYPAVEVSEFGSWGEVVNWALPLYHPAEIPQWPSLADGIVGGNGDSEKRILTALSFVQHDIRYLGIEMGAGSHRPSRPSDVVKRKFGDCKDKALLFVSLLGRMGEKACPALVLSDGGKALSGVLPSPLAFDHVIVRLERGGRYYWLDPTMTYQKGMLDSLYQPDYGYALPLEEGGGELISMTGKPYGEPTIDVIQDFDLSGGTGEPAGYTVQTVRRGDNADYIRERYANRTKKEMQDDYLGVLAKEYGGIEVAKDFTFEDDGDANTVTLREYYRVPDIWKYDKEKGRARAEFYPYDVGTYIDTPPRKKRTMPMIQTYPVYVRERIRLRLPRGWRLKDEDMEIRNGCFVFNYAKKVSGNHVELSYSYRTLKDHVPVEEMAGYVKDTGEVLDNISYSIWEQDGNGKEAASGPNFNAAIIAGLFIAGFAVYAYVKKHRIKGG
jgi:transglutaminase-like putative cysteine protease